ncbi:hypothetical protein [Fluviicola sp.]|uniref:hypothetical protein n=1 Tax=Fluviicola sp. TaxID=1917219 RepID=UPI0031D96949
MSLSYEMEKTYESKDRKIAGIISISALVLILTILHFLGYRIPTPPLPEQLLYKDMEMELIPVEVVEVKPGGGGGGSGKPANAQKTETTPEQMEQVLTQSSSSTHVKSGNSSFSNTTKPNNNPPSAQNTSTDPFSGKGGSGGGDGSGKGHGIGNDTGDGNGQGTGPGSGGDVNRYLVSKPNTNNISSDENCTIVFSVLVAPDGSIIGKPTYVKASSTTNDMTLINQVIKAIESQARFNKVETTKNMKQAITIRITAN